MPGSTWLSFSVVFIGTAELYCGYRFIIPMYFPQYGEWAPFYMKVSYLTIVIHSKSSKINFNITRNNFSINVFCCCV